MSNIRVGTQWVLKHAKSPRQVYTVLDSDDEGVVASTHINLGTTHEDSFSWFSSFEDFVKAFALVSKS